MIIKKPEDVSRKVTGDKVIFSIKGTTVELKLKRIRKMVGFESVKKWRKMFFVLSRALDKQKNFLSPLEQSNRRPLDSALRCSTEPQRFYSKRGLLRNLCMTSFSISLPNSKLIIFLILLTNMTLSTSLNR